MSDMDIYVGPNTLEHFSKKYLGDPDNIKGLGDGTVTGAIKDLNDSLVCEALGIRLASSRYTMVSNASCIFYKSFAAISVVVQSTSQITVGQPLFAMNSYQPKFKGRLSMVQGTDASTVVWQDNPDAGSGGVTWCTPAISIPANTPVAIIGTIAVDPL